MYAELDTKICTKCKCLKTLAEFPNDKSRNDGKFPWCKTCKKSGDKKDYATNPEPTKQRAKAWKLENPERTRELRAGYKKRNKTKVNANTAKYKVRNKGVTNANTAKRRAALMLRTPAWLTATDLGHIRAFYDAAAKLTEETGVKFVVDHIIPLQGQEISGLHVPANLQVIPEKENLSKKNRYKV